jgi:chromosome partitioning protein
MLAAEAVAQFRNDFAGAKHILEFVVAVQRNGAEHNVIVDVRMVIMRRHEEREIPVQQPGSQLIALLPGEGIIHHAEGVDLLPSSIALAGTEVSLVNAMSRESTLKQVINNYKKDYDYILIDCMPSLGMLTINALAAAERVVIPVQANYLSAKGLEQLLQTIAKVRRQINPKLKIDGILMTMVDGRTNNAKEITKLIRDTYGSKISVFEAEIPHSVRAAEASLAGKSIFAYDPGGKVAQAYHALTKEVIQLEKQRQKAKADLLR